MTIRWIVMHPPYWIISGLVAVLVAHSIERILKVIKVIRGRRPSDLIVMLELMVTSGLLFLCVESAIERSATSKAASWLDGPLPVVLLLVYFTLISMVVYAMFSLLHSK